MDRTSAAEANLNARVRPQIVALRAKTPYPKRRPEGSAAAGVGGQRPALALVGAAVAAPGPVVTGSRAGAAGPGGGVRLSVVKLSAAQESVAGRPAGPAARAAGRPVAGARTPIKLTRRGRVVVGVLIGFAVTAVALIIWLAVAGRAQASNQVGPRVPVSDSVSRVVVRPGDTLWGIAAKADPSADPRAVEGEIIDLNSLSSTAIQVGQVLLIPKG